MAGPKEALTGPGRHLEPRGMQSGVGKALAECPVRLPTGCGIIPKPGPSPCTHARMQEAGEQGEGRSGLQHSAGKRQLLNWV